MRPRPPRSTLFPYTTLFRSREASRTVLIESTSEESSAAFEEAFRELESRARAELIDEGADEQATVTEDRKSTRLNSSHSQISYAVFCLKKKKKLKVTHLTWH